MAVASNGTCRARGVVYDASSDAELVALFRDGDSGAREALVRRHLDVARTVAWSHRHYGEDHEDLVQVAIIGLINACERFDASRGRFRTYAVALMIGEIRLHLRDRTWPISVPRSLKDLRPKILAAEAALQERLRRAPTLAEIAAEADVPATVAADALLAADSRAPASLSDPVGGDGDGALCVEDTLGACDDAYDRVVDRAAIASRAGALAPRERHVLRRWYFDGATQGDIASELGISQMHVSRLARGATAKLAGASTPRGAGFGGHAEAIRQPTRNDA